MGLVYLAEDPSLHRQVAVKMLEIGADSDSDREFLRGDGARSAQATLDAVAIMQGMAQARDASQRVARDLHPDDPGAASPAVTR